MSSALGNRFQQSRVDPQVAGKRGEGLRFEHVSHSFRSRGGSLVSVLDDVEFDVASGEFVCVVGPSGCGKSTLLGLAAGFHRPTQGTIRWRGSAIAKPGPRCGLVFQTPELYPWLTVWDNVMFGPKATGARQQKAQAARDLLKEVGLVGFERHRPHELSGGMQHRVALARTLVTEPGLLLMDEPFAALDAQTRQTMQALLLRIWQHHQRTVLFVTHDIEEATLLADRVVVLSRRPARVREVIDIRLRRPRDPDLIFDAEFVELRRRLRDSVLDR